MVGLYLVEQKFKFNESRLVIWTSLLLYT